MSKIIIEFKHKYTCIFPKCHLLIEQLRPLVFTFEIFAFSFSDFLALPECPVQINGSWILQLGIHVCYVFFWIQMKPLFDFVFLFCSAAFRMAHTAITICDKPTQFMRYKTQQIISHQISCISKTCGSVTLI